VIREQQDADARSRVGGHEKAQTVEARWIPKGFQTEIKAGREGKRAKGYSGEVLTGVPTVGGKGGTRGPGGKHNPLVVKR